MENDKKNNIAKAAVTEKDRPKKCSSNSSYSQFEMGIRHWENGNFKESEKWLRYASNQGHALAASCLQSEIERGVFLSVEGNLNKFAVDILERLVTPSPTDTQVNGLRAVLVEHLDSNYNLFYSKNSAYKLLPTVSGGTK